MQSCPPAPVARPAPSNSSASDWVSHASDPSGAHDCQKTMLCQANCLTGKCPGECNAPFTVSQPGGAAAQGLHGLDAVLGRNGREALLNNFGSCFFFAARENGLD